MVWIEWWYLYIYLYWIITIFRYHWDHHVDKWYSLNGDSSWWFHGDDWLVLLDEFFGWDLLLMNWTWWFSGLLCREILWGYHNIWLVVGPATPLKNDGLRQLGWLDINPIFMGKSSKWQPNHQPAWDFPGDFHGDSSNRDAAARPTPGPARSAARWAARWRSPRCLRWRPWKLETARKMGSPLSHAGWFLWENHGKSHWNIHSHTWILSHSLGVPLYRTLDGFVGGKSHLNRWW